MSTRAVVLTKSVPMHDDACADKVCAHLASLSVQPFSAEDARALVEATCGRYTRGAHKGKLRGWARIKFVESGGWYRGDDGLGRVLYPGAILGVSIEDFNGKVYVSR